MEESCEECGGGKEVWSEGVGSCAEGEKAGVFGHVVRRGRWRSWEILSVLWRRGGGHLEDLKRSGEEICKNLQV